MNMTKEEKALYNETINSSFIGCAMPTSEKSLLIFNELVRKGFAYKTNNPFTNNMFTMIIKSCEE